MTTLNIQPIRLLKGSHADTASTGSGSFMNVISYLNGEPQITDESPCVAPILRSIYVRINDFFASNGWAQDLIPFIPRAMGSAGRVDEQAVAYMCADAACRVFAPIALEASGMITQAASLRSISPIVDEKTARADAAHAAAYAAYAVNKQAIRREVLALLDRITPQADDAQQQHIDRATELVCTAQARGTALEV